MTIIHSPLSDFILAKPHSDVNQILEVDFSTEKICCLVDKGILGYRVCLSFLKKVTKKFKNNMAHYKIIINKYKAKFKVHFLYAASFHSCSLGVTLYFL